MLLSPRGLISVPPGDPTRCHQSSKALILGARPGVKWVIPTTSRDSTLRLQRTGRKPPLWFQPRPGHRGRKQGSSHLLPMPSTKAEGGVLDPGGCTQDSLWPAGFPLALGYHPVLLRCVTSWQSLVLPSDPSLGDREPSASKQGVWFLGALTSRKSLRPLLTAARSV